MIDDFKLIVINTPPKLNDQEKRSITTSFGSSYQDQSIENNREIIMTHILKRWNGKKSSAHPSKHALIRDEPVALNVYSIEIK